MDIKSIYDENFYRIGRDINYRSAKIILTMLFNHYKPNSVIDIGCGIGAWLRAAMELGVKNIVGIDGNEVREDFLFVPRKYIKIADLETHKNINNDKYDLAISVEVAEHLDNSCSNNFIETLTSYSNVVLFSAAIPYQGGEHHINCQPPQFWVDIFGKYGFLSFDFRNDLMNLWEEINPCYSQNMLLFVNKNYIDSLGFNNLILTNNRPIFYYHPAYVNAIVEYDTQRIFQFKELLSNESKKLRDYMEFSKSEIERYRLRSGWIKLFNISNNSNYLRITIFGIKITFKITDEIVRRIAWFIPLKILRNKFKLMFKSKTNDFV